MVEIWVTVHLLHFGQQTWHLWRKFNKAQLFSTLKEWTGKKLKQVDPRFQGLSRIILEYCMAKKFTYSVAAKIVVIQMNRCFLLTYRSIVGKLLSNWERYLWLETSIPLPTLTILWLSLVVLKLVNVWTQSIDSISRPENGSKWNQNKVLIFQKHVQDIRLWSTKIYWSFLEARTKITKS